MAARHHVPLTAMEEQILLNSRRLQTLMEDNQKLASDHVALKQQLAHAQQELIRFSSAAASVKAERDFEVREVYERLERMRDEYGSSEEMREELERVVKEVGELNGEVDRLRVEEGKVGKETGEARRAGEEMMEIIREVEAIRSDIVKGRAAIEYEKKIRIGIPFHDIQEISLSIMETTRAAIEYEKKIRITNQEQRQAMERDMIVMAREIESLRSELAIAEKRFKAAAAVSVAGPHYAASSENPGMGYGSSSYPDPSGMNQVNSHANFYPHYGSGAMPNSPLRQTQVPYGSPLMPNGHQQPTQMQFVAEAISNGSLQQVHGH